MNVEPPNRKRAIKANKKLAKAQKVPKRRNQPHSHGKRDETFYMANYGKLGDDNYSDPEEDVVVAERQPAEPDLFERKPKWKVNRDYEAKRKLQQE